MDSAKCRRHHAQNRAERLPDCDRVPRNCSLMLYAIKYATQKSVMEVSLAQRWYCMWRVLPMMMMMMIMSMS